MENLQETESKLEGHQHLYNSTKKHLNNYMPEMYREPLFWVLRVDETRQAYKGFFFLNWVSSFFKKNFFMVYQE